MGSRAADPKRATRALVALASAGVAFTVHEYETPPPAAPRERSARPHYGLDAAAAIGMAPARIFKTLVASVDGQLVVGVVPVAGELNLKALASAAGGRRAEMADPAEAERATGYVVGGISPLGLRRRLACVVDASAMAWPTIFVSAGRRGLQVELAADDLVRVAAAVVAPIGRVGG